MTAKKRTREDVEKEYWATLRRIGKFDHPKLSALRKELKQIDNKTLDIWQLH